MNNKFILPTIIAAVCCCASMMVLSVPLDGTPCDVNPPCNKTECSGAFEEYSCDYGCYEPTCAVRTRNIQCFVSGKGCICKQGYIRAYDNGPCIPVGDCPC
ncbi:hypothetical protein RP20_CCG019770 [Aedes albopictus]|nr:hypothetical protein RP20_CCG019770 [Aedes albopictus]